MRLRPAAQWARRHGSQRRQTRKTHGLVVFHICIDGRKGDLRAVLVGFIAGGVVTAFFNAESAEHADPVGKSPLRRALAAFGAISDILRPWRYGTCECG